MGEIFGAKAAITARKTHVCYWCGEPIKAGERYDRWMYKDNGNANEIKAHDECSQAWSEAASESWEGYFLVEFGEFNRGCRCQNGACECESEATE